MLKGNVNSSLKNGIGELTFFSEKANCLNSVLLKEIIEKIKQLSTSSECRVIYLNSVGNTFCAGAYFDELKAIKSLSDAKAFFSLFGEITVLLREASQPVVVRLQGPAVGGGVGILASADLAFGVKESSVKLSEFDVGIGPFVISPVIEAKIGKSRLMELALSGVTKDSNWCLASGLLSEVAQDLNQLETNIKACLDKIGNFSLANTSGLKRLITPSNLRELVGDRAMLAAKALLKA